MGNTFSYFSNNSTEKLNSFKVEKVPTFQDISQELKKGPITALVMDNIFEKCCFMDIDYFFDTYKADDTLKCQHRSEQQEWFFTCKECCLADNSCLCSSCFLSGGHIEAGHAFTLFESGLSAVCDCGNPDAIKQQGFCSDHQHVDEKSKKERLDKLPFFIKKDVHIFFRYLFQYLQMITTTSKASSVVGGKIEKEVEDDIFTIIGWLLEICKESSTLIHIIAEEFTSRVLDPVNFKLYDLKPLPYKNDEEESIQQQWEGHHFLGFIFSKIDILDQYLPLLTLLLDNHSVFKTALFEEYLKNYINIFTPRDTNSSRIMQCLGSYYMEQNKLLVPFSTGYSRYNLLELILRSHKVIYMPLLLPFYQTDKKIEREVMLQTDIIAFSQLMKVPSVVKYFTGDQDKFKLFFEFAETLHQFTSPQFVDPSITTTKFLLLIEHRLIHSMKSLLETIQKENDQELLATVCDSIAEKIVHSIGSIKKRPMNQRCGLKLPHQDFFQKFTYNEIPVHFPLYRLLSTFLLTTKMDVTLLTSKYGLPEDDVVDMLTTLLLFRICYVSYDPNESLENCTDITMISDLHMMQVSLCLLGSRKFLYSFFNVMTSVDTTSSASAFTDTFALLISSLQLRPTLTPTKKDIQFHLLQGIFSGIFFKLHFRSFDTILIGVNENEICETYLPEIATTGNQAKDLLDTNDWKYYDPYYPNFSIVYRVPIKTNAKERFKKYQTALKLPESNPLPPSLDPLPLELSKVNSIFNDPTLFEIIFCIVLDCVHPTFIGYDNSFEMQPILKMLVQKPLNILNEFFYLLVLGIKSFKDYTYPTLDEVEKQLINQSIIDYFNGGNNSGEEGVESVIEYRSNFKFTKTKSSYAIYNLLHVFNVELEVGKKEKMSFLDLLFQVWTLMTKKSQFLDLRSSILFIFNFLIDFNPIFKQVFKDNNIDLVQDVESSQEDQLLQKKLMAEKREKLLEQMRQQQKSFLNHLNYGNDDEDEDDEEEPTKESKEEEEKVEEKVVDVAKEVKEEEGKEVETTTSEQQPTADSETIKIEIQETDEKDFENQRQLLKSAQQGNVDDDDVVSNDDESGGESEGTQGDDDHDEQVGIEKQEQFVVNENYVDDEHEHGHEEEVNPTTTTTTATTTTSTKSTKSTKSKNHNHHHRNIEISNDEPVGEFEHCIICKTGLSNGRLFSMGYIDLSSPNHQNRIQSNFNLTNDEKQGFDPRYQQFIETFFLTDIKPGSTQYIPYHDDPAGLFACYIFLRSPSTYISSCHHNIHKKCLDNYIKEQPKLDHESDLIYAFKCPLCSRPCDLIIPLGKPDETIQYKAAAKDLFTKLCYYDFLVLMDPISKYSIDRYLWKFVLQNIETLELKSRKTTIYNDSPSDDPYFLMSETDFQKELTTTTRLYNVIMTADVDIEDETLPIYDQCTFFMDPFTSSTYSLFLSPKDHLVVLFNGISLYIFNSIIFHCIKTNVIPKESINNTTVVHQVVYDEFCRLFFSETPLQDSVRSEFINYIHPYIRKLLIMLSLIQSITPGVVPPHLELSLSLDTLSDFSKCIRVFSHDSLESLITSLMNKKFFDHTLGQFLKKKKITPNISSTPQIYCTFPPPCEYTFLPHFIDLPNKYVDFMKDYITSGYCGKCKSLLKIVCLLCGEGTCTTPNCKSGSVGHLYQCPSYPLGYFHLIDKPMVQVYTMQYGSFKSSGVYSHVYLDKQGLKTNTPNCDLTLSNKKLKKLFKCWIDNNNSRKFLIK